MPSSPFDAAQPAGPAGTAIHTWYQVWNPAGTPAGEVSAMASPPVASLGSTTWKPGGSREGTSAPA